MRIKANHILYGINVLTLLLILIITFLPDSVLRIILGLPMLLFFPGYVLLSALFPRKNSISDIERFALSFGLSIAVVPLIGLGLNYTAWGIRLYPVLVSLAVFILLMSIISWFRSRRLSPDERISFTVPSISAIWTARSKWDKLLNIVLVVVVLATVSTLVYVIAKPKTGERFTEFYLLGREGKAADYPEAVTLGKSAEVTVGIINREQATTTYTIRVTINQVPAAELGPVTLENDEKWEGAAVFTPGAAGQDQKVEFKLYRTGIDEVYLTTHLWIDVNETLSP